MRHRRGGGREVTVTSELHTQEDRDTELNIVIDEIGPGEGRLGSWGIEGPFNPAGEGGVAQVPAGSPAQATTCCREEKKWPFGNTTELDYVQRCDEKACWSVQGNTETDLDDRGRFRAFAGPPWLPRPSR